MGFSLPCSRRLQPSEWAVSMSHELVISHKVYTISALMVPCAGIFKTVRIGRII